VQFLEHWKDFVGPVVSSVAALLSLIFFLLNWRLAWRLANRGIYVEGQKLLVEICKQLMDDPKLWAIYDDSRLPELVDNAEFQGKLRGFAHLHLNMFEIMFLEAPRRGIIRENQSDVWVRYFNNTLSNSTLLREVLEEPASKGIWSKRMLRIYEKWKQRSVPR
jgi:hypothetical protein